MSESEQGEDGEYENLTEKILAGDYEIEDGQAEHDSLYSQPPEDEEGGDEGEEEGNVDKAAEGSYEAADDALLDAIKKSSWWYTEDYTEGAELSKAPGIWRHDDQVPEIVQELIADVIENTNWDWGTFENLSHQQAQDLTDLLKEKLTQPQGWSLSSLSEDIQRRFDLPEDTATGIAADTSHNVLNTAREQAYETLEDSEEFVYDWIGPQDHRTTPTCTEIKEEIEDRGGAVTMPTLKQILRQKAQKYQGTSEGGGTPGRVDHWEPHFQCRHTLTRKVQSI